MNTQIYDEAGEWIVRHRSDDLDAEAKRQFDAWLRESPQHVRAYLELSSIWEDVPAIDPHRNANADELIARARADANVVPFEMPASAEIRVEASSATVPGTSRHTGEHQRARSEVRPRLGVRLSGFSIAASMLVVLAVAGWLNLQRGVYATDIGEQRAIALTDGSSIQLNARSKIRVHYSDDERAIDLLQGQALFRVAKDSSRPFIVASNGTRVRAVGTQFDVYRKSGGTIVTVVEGKVAVFPVSAPELSMSPATQDSTAGAASVLDQRNIGIASVKLSAGEQILIAETISNAVPKPANIDAAIAWTQQRLVFDFTPLTEVAEEFNRYNHRPLVIEDAGLQQFLVSGSFSSTDPTLLLRFLRDQPAIAVHDTGTEIRISGQRTDSGTG